MNITRIVSTKCAQREHPQFRLAFDSAIPQADVDVLVSFLEHSVQEGTRFEVGQTIEFGSMLLRVAALDDFLTLQEPDLQTFPISWTMGITQAMKLLRLQKDIAESVGLVSRLNFPSIRCSLLIGIDLVKGFDALILERSEPNGSDSGWFIGRLDTGIDYDDAEKLRRISVYHAVLAFFPHISV